MRRQLLSLAALLTAGCHSAGPRALAPARPDARDALLTRVSALPPVGADSSLILLHVGTPAEYAVGHLPGARLVSVAQLSVSDTVRKLSIQMPGADTLRARLATLGIGDASRVVVYVGKDALYPATRILFTLFYAGLGNRATLLDGGQGAWVAAGRALSTATPPASQGQLSPLALHSFVVDAEYVQSQIDRAGVSIVDARDVEFYTGARRGGSAQAPQRAGHVPSAKSVPWTQLYDAELRLKPREELARIFASAGVGANDVIIGYCHTGQQATAMLFAARSLGHTVLLYDGSYQDWSARTDLPVEMGRR